MLYEFMNEPLILKSSHFINYNAHDNFVNNNK